MKFLLVYFLWSTAHLLTWSDKSLSLSSSSCHFWLFFDFSTFCTCFNFRCSSCPFAFVKLFLLLICFCHLFPFLFPASICTCLRPQRKNTLRAHFSFFGVLHLAFPFQVLTRADLWLRNTCFLKKISFGFCIFWSFRCTNAFVRNFRLGLCNFSPYKGC